MLSKFSKVKNKKGIAIFSVVVILIIIADLFYYNALNVPYINNLNQGIRALEGYPTYINGRMWRLNQTNYIIWTKGRIINLETDHTIGNFSECYAVTVEFNVNSLFLSFNQTALPYFKNETSCESDY